MKSVTRPPSDANGVAHRGDDLDEVLFAFFRSEMPRPWPALQLPDGAPPAPPLPPRVRPAQPAPAPSPRPWFHSPRFALAASVALLIAGYAVMSAALGPPAAATDPDLKGTTANPQGSPFEAPKANGKAPETIREIDAPNIKGPDKDIDIHESLLQDGDQPTTRVIEVFRKK
jgi:hypothetical protein